MCGVYGVFSYGRSTEPDRAGALERARDAMLSRGPDGRGGWRSADGAVSLGHLRLAIIDLTEDGAQPFETADGRFTVVFNGEIYNYRELKAELEGNGSRFKSHSDTEVIVELYRKIGHAAFGRLRGMFALAMWDGQTGELVFARDPFGIKPLYIADDGATLRFASQVKALAAMGGVDLTPDPAAQVGFFIWGHVPEPFTIYKAVTAFPAGHYQVCRRDGMKAPIAFGSVRDVMAASLAAREPQNAARRTEFIREAVADSIRHHHVADVPVGIFLSAGIDSTVIASTSGERVGPGSTTFTLGFNEFRGTEADETVLAQTVAERLGTSHVTRWVRSEDFAGSFDHLMSAMDQPSIDGVNTYLVSKLAAEAGLKVVLSGLGGDEMFGGYSSFAEVPKLARIAGAVPGARQIGPLLRASTAGWIGRFTSPKYAGLLEYGSGLFGAYLLRRSLFMPWELPAILDPDLVVKGLDRLALVERGEEAIRGVDDPYAAVTVLEMTHYMRDRLLRDSDWASMAHSLELRVPLVDWRLYETLAPLIASGTPPRKADLARVPARELPAEIRNRRKTGFSVPVRNWVRQDLGMPSGADRGLRDWSRLVYQTFVPAAA